MKAKENKTISEILDDLTKHIITIVNELPQEGLLSTIYILDTGEFEIKDEKAMKIYEEYIWYGSWHLIERFMKEEI